MTSEAGLQQIDVKGQWTALSLSATEQDRAGGGAWVIPSQPEGTLGPDRLPTSHQDTVCCL